MFRYDNSHFNTKILKNIYDPSLQNPKYSLAKPWKNVFNPSSPTRDEARDLYMNVVIPKQQNYKLKS